MYDQMREELPLQHPRWQLNSYVRNKTSKCMPGFAKASCLFYVFPAQASTLKLDNPLAIRGRPYFARGGPSTEDRFEDTSLSNIIVEFQLWPPVNSAEIAQLLPNGKRWNSKRQGSSCHMTFYTKSSLRAYVACGIKHLLQRPQVPFIGDFQHEYTTSSFQSGGPQKGCFGPAH